MALAMATPWLHPRTRVYYLRRRVPDDLKAVLGRGEVRRSLGTRDPKEAKRLFTEALAELEAQWANLRGGTRTLSEKEAHILAASIGREFVAHYQNYPSRQDIWHIEAGADLFAPKLPVLAQGESAVNFINRDFDPLSILRHDMREWCEKAADGKLARDGLRVDPNSRLELVRAISRAMQIGALQLREMSQGHWTSEPPENVPSQMLIDSKDTKVHELKSPSVIIGAVQFEVLIEGWLRERQPAPKTAYVFPRVVKEFVSFLGHSNAMQVTEDDILRWKASLLDQGLKGSTIRNGKIGPLKTILQWGVDNRKIPVNVARGTKISTKAQNTDRKRDPTEDEVATILSAAEEASDCARRWIPWLCAYTGARVAEICQLRKEDVYVDGSIHVLAIRPEAGSLKNANSERTIPVHPKLISQGFIKFAASAKSGPLFADIPPDRFGSRGGNGSKVLCRWIRSLGLVDPRLQPNHGWRHRFSSLSRDNALREDVTIYLLGRQKSVSGQYGGYGLPMLLEQISRIP